MPKTIDKVLNGTAILLLVACIAVTLLAAATRNWEMGIPALILLATYGAHRLGPYVHALVRPLLGSFCPDRYKDE